MTSIFRRHPRGRPPHPDVLTPAEWRVLDEVRDGRSNPEIAERLGLSRNTVKTHVSSILDKLELRDRSDIAVWRGQPAEAQRSPLLVPFAWLASRSEAVVMSAIGAVVVAGLVVAAQSGVLTDSPEDVSVMPVDTATEVVATSAAPPIPDCPVLDEVCTVAVEFLPLMRAADGQAIAAQATTQKLACPAATPIPDQYEGIEAFVGTCEAGGPGVDVDVYEWHNGKGPFYYTDADEFSGTVSDVLQELISWSGALRLVAVGCGSAGEQLPPDCARTAIAVYATTSSPATPVPIATPLATVPGGKPIYADTGAQRPSFIALVFNRTDESAEWHVQRFQAYVSQINWPLLPGEEAKILTDGGTRVLSQLFGYDFG